MRRSGIREVMELAASNPDVIHLEVGEPDFPTPAHVAEAAATAPSRATRSTPRIGGCSRSARRRLRSSLARTGFEADPEEIVVTTGGVTALAEALLALVEPGDEILLLDPAWPNYEMMAATLRARVGGETHLAVSPEFRTVDLLGAGDAFCAGFLHGLLAGDQQRALELGGAMAALKQSIPGDWAIVTPAEVEDLLSGAAIRTRC
jgi:sugar/nucleoside kinase (ribokinase family)